MKKIGEIEKVTCLGCGVIFEVLKCRGQKYCSAGCYQDNKPKKLINWEWRKKVMEEKRIAEERLKETSAHRATIFTGGHEEESVLWGYSEGEII